MTATEIEVHSLPEKYTAPERVYHYRKAGVSFADIAFDMGMSVPQAVQHYRSYMTQLAASYGADERHHTIMMELERLDDLQIKAQAMFDVDDPKIVLQAIDKVLNIMKQRASLLGLDQVTPDKQTVNNILVLTQDRAEFVEALQNGRRQPVLMGGVDPDDESDPEAKENS